MSMTWTPLFCENNFYSTLNIPDLYSVFTQSSGVSIDSRSCREGNLFFAIQGERIDGNDFALSALSAGCIKAIVDRPDLRDVKDCIYVEDSLKCLQSLANYHRKSLNIPILAITGSNGKTTTKELIASVLGAKYHLAYTTGNLNNHLGVPLTLLAMDGSHEIGVVEMGANHVGEIAHLCEIAQPNCGLITNIGRAHLEGFGSYEGVKQAKGELYDYIRSTGGRLFVNCDNEELLGMSAGIECEYYGKSCSKGVQGSLEDESNPLRVRWKSAGEEYVSCISLEGGYNLENILAACCVGSYWEVPKDKIHLALEAYAPNMMRSQRIVTARNTVILDAYNANPSSMELAIVNHGKKDDAVFILGDMRELGDFSYQEHRRVVDLVNGVGADLVCFVGQNFKVLADEFSSATLFFFSDKAELVTFLKDRKLENKDILIKGSRGLLMEKILDADCI